MKDEAETVTRLCATSSIILYFILKAKQALYMLTEG